MAGCACPVCGHEGAPTPRARSRVRVQLAHLQEELAGFYRRRFDRVDKAMNRNRLFRTVPDKQLEERAKKMAAAMKALLRAKLPGVIKEAASIAPGQTTELCFLVDLVEELAPDPKKQLTDAIKVNLKDAHKAGVEAARLQEAEVQIKVDWDMLDQEASDFLDRHALALANKLDADVEWELRSAVQDGLLAGGGAKGLERYIRDAVNDLEDGYENRSLVVARTEGMRAMNQGRLAGYAEMDVEEVVWIASDLACPKCRPLDGQIFAIDEAPEIPLHPNCRCTVGAVTDYTQRKGDRVVWGAAGRQVSIPDRGGEF